MRSYEMGSHTALAQLGLEKQADEQPAAPGYWGQTWNDIRTGVFGKPKQVWNELRTGTWRDPNSHVRSSIWAYQKPEAGANFGTRALARVAPALNYLPSAIGLYGAYKAPSDQKGEAYGSAFGGLAGAMLGMPFGVAGNALGSIVGSHFGGSFGRKFNKKPQQPTYHPPQDPQNTYGEQSNYGQPPQPGNYGATRAQM